MSTSFKSALKSLAMIVALWAPVYFALVEGFGLASHAGVGCAASAQE
jgi:hypothetical protein